jgi:hypothetical protein
MAISNSNNVYGFRRQLLVVLKTYLTRWDFYCALILCCALSASQSGRWRRPKSPDSPRPVIAPYDIPTNLQTHISVDGQRLSFDNPADAKIPEKADSVSLWGPGITDEVLVNVARVSSITMLYASNTSITDLGLAELKKLPKLRMLSILGSVAHGSGLDGLADSGKLTNLSFSATHLDSDGVRMIAKIKSLKSLELHAVLVKETDLFPLRDLIELGSINLGYAEVTDWSVSWLPYLKKLRQIDIGNTRVTKHGVRQLRKFIPGIRVAGVSSIEDRSHLVERDDQTKAAFENVRINHLSSLLFPGLVLGVWLGVHLKVQFAAPRARMTPGFAKAHLTVPGCLFLFAAALPALGACNTAGIALPSVFAIQTAGFAWCLWLAHRNSALMLFSGFGVVGLIAFANPSTHTLLLESFVPVSPTLPSMLLLFAGLAGLSAYAVRLTRFHEAMSEYGMVFSFDMAWDLASRSANRRRQQMEANAISKSVVNAWLLDHQFDFAMRHLPNSRLARAVGLLQISHGLAALWSIPMMVLMSGGIMYFSGVIDEPKSGVPFAPMIPLFMTAMIPMMSMSMLNGQWLQHWRWFSSELLRPQTKRRYVSSILTTMAVDGAIAIAVPVALVTAFVLRGWTVGEFSAPQTWLLCAVHIFANIVTTVSVVAWLTSYRRAWVSILVMTVALFTHGGLTALSLELGPAWIPVVLPALFVAAIVTATLTMITATRRWNSLEFA